MIWTESYLNQLNTNAGQQINQDLPCIWQRFTFPITAGLSVYTLPSFVRSVLNIQYRGRYLDKGNWEDMTILTPATVFVAPGSGENIETAQGKPLWYAMHPTNVYDVRLFPCPDETFTNDLGDTPYAPDGGPKCIITCLRSIDDTEQDASALLPAYIDRRTRKAYIMSKAYRSEGDGQNLIASDYYTQKYEFLIQQFKLINRQPFIGKRYGLGEGNLEIDTFRYPRPSLNPNFERVIY